METFLFWAIVIGIIVLIIKRRNKKKKATLLAKIRQDNYQNDYNRRLNELYQDVIETMTKDKGSPLSQEEIELTKQHVVNHMRQKENEAIEQKNDAAITDRIRKAGLIGESGEFVPGELVDPDNSRQGEGGTIYSKLL
jgi:isopropylmalate/homocitrate/citramalate synthase